MAGTYMGAREINIWVFITMFMIYSTLGAILEQFLHVVGPTKGFRKIRNPILTGFPLYGIGAYIIIGLHRAFVHKWNVVSQFVFFGLILSVIEYIAGKILGAGPENYLQEDGSLLYWDYTGRPLNIHGLVDLEHFVIYGVLGVIVGKIHPKIVNRVNRALQKSYH